MVRPLIENKKSKNEDMFRSSGMALSLSSWNSAVFVTTWSYYVTSHWPGVALKLAPGREELTKCCFAVE
jgi:hypothetical protein